MKNSAFMLKFYNWKDILFLYSDEPIIKVLSEGLAQMYESMGIRIINPVELRVIPSNYSRDDLENHRNIFEFIKDSKCRILAVVFSSYTGMIYESLYDVGLRKGEIIVLGNFHTYYCLLTNDSSKFLDKRREILDGAIVSSLYEYVGDIGEKLEVELKKKYDNTINMCLTYDSFLTISNSIDYLINKGEDYEDPKILIKAMRMQNFIGCSGYLYFSPFQNSRSINSNVFSQLRLNSSTNHFSIIRVAIINSISISAFTLIHKPDWPAIKNPYNSNYRTDEICDGNIHKKISIYSRIMMHSFSLVILILTLILSFFSSRKFNDEFVPMTQKVYPSFYDYYSMSFHLLEFFQVIALHSSLNIFIDEIKKVVYVIGLDVITAFDLKNDNYWKILKFILVLVGSYILLAMVSIAFKMKAKKTNDFIKNLLNTFLPLLGHFTLMPLLNMMLGIFKCEEGLNNELSSSTFYRDCRKFCYQGQHKFYSIFASLSILIYTSISVYFRPFWEITQEELNIKTKSYYLSILSVFQVILVLLKYNIGDYSEIFAGFSESIVLIIFIFITFKSKPYSNNRSIVYQILALSASLWFAVVNTISLIFNIAQCFLIIFFVGLLVLSVFGIWMMSKYPSFLLSDDPNIIPELIRFQFNGGLSKSIILRKYSYTSRITSLQKNASHK